MLAAALRAQGHDTHRINLGGGDRFDWGRDGVDFAGALAEWPAYLAQYLDDHVITDVLLFGDCRPYHIIATKFAADRGIHVHVLEEGYIRPDWMTLELGGVNANSSFSRDPEWLLAEAKRLPPLPRSLPRVTASFNRRARDGFWYYAHHTLGAWRFPHYLSHRPVNVFVEMAGWAWRLLRQGAWRRAARATTAALEHERYFLFPLQLSTDYQIRMHSPYRDMLSAARDVIAAFAAHAPSDVQLLIKVHPLDVSLTPWRRALLTIARTHGAATRVHVIDGGDLEQVLGAACGVVCVNSTVGTLALASGVPVKVLGSAIYDIPRLTEQRDLSAFFAAPAPVDAAVFNAFQTLLVDHCLVRGGIASRSAVKTLIASILERLGRDDTASGAQDGNATSSSSHESTREKWSDQPGETNPSSLASWASRRGAAAGR